jgi:hypothetical protein
VSSYKSAQQPVSLVVSRDGSLILPTDEACQRTIAQGRTAVKADGFRNYVTVHVDDRSREPYKAEGFRHSGVINLVVVYPQANMGNFGIAFSMTGASLWDKSGELRPIAAPNVHAVAFGNSKNKGSGQYRKAPIMGEDLDALCAVSPSLAEGRAIAERLGRAILEGVNEAAPVAHTATVVPAATRVNVAAETRQERRPAPAAPAPAPVAAPAAPDTNAAILALLTRMDERLTALESKPTRKTAAK